MGDLEVGQLRMSASGAHPSVAGRGAHADSHAVEDWIVDSGNIAKKLAARRGRPTIKPDATDIAACTRCERLALWYYT